MKTLRQIISVVTRKRISKVEIFDKTLLSTEDSKFTQLYNAIEADDVKTDQEASLLMYGDENSANYRKLKSRFLKRLLNTLFFLDLNSKNKANDSRYNHYSCTKALMHAKLLRFFGAFASAAKILKLKYNDAERFEFSDLISEYSWFLLQYYCLTGNEKALNIEVAKHLKYSKIAKSESESQLIYYTSIIGFVKFSAVSQEMINTLKEGIKKIEIVVKEYPTGINIYHTGLMKFMLSESLFDWNQLLLDCDDIHEALCQKPHYYNKGKKAIIEMKKFVACLNLRRFDLGLDLYNGSKDAFDSGSYNWSLIRKYGALLSLHADRRNLAYIILASGLDPKVAKYMNKTISEFWAIFRAYCYFLVNIHAEQDKLVDIDDFKKFRLYKFLNEVPIYSKDKSGNNVALLIIQYMFLLMDKKYEDIIQKMDSLKVYRSRYLKEEEYKRAYVFTGMLIKVEKDSFIFKKTNKTCAKDYELLKNNHPGNESNKDNQWPINESEIIPYERLWSYILQILQYNDLPDELKARRKSIILDEEEMV